jgi:hypothetical protein
MDTAATAEAVLSITRMEITMKTITALLVAAAIALAPTLALAGANSPSVSPPPYPYSKAQPGVLAQQLAQGSTRADCVRACSQQLGACGQSDACRAAWYNCTAACPAQ